MPSAVRGSLYVLLFSALTLAAVVGGCATTGHTTPEFAELDGGSTPFGDGGVQLNPMTGPAIDLEGGTPQGTCSADLVSIKVSPASMAVSVTYANPLPTH